jgi:hypothetical protein
MPVSPDGPVSGFKSEYVSTEVFISTNGVYAVAETAHGTFAETGTVVDGRPDSPPYDPPLEGAMVTYSSLSGPGLPAPPGGDVSVTTTTGYDGAYAFIDLPVRGEGSCYRFVIVASGVGRYESVDIVTPDVYYRSVELNVGIERENEFGYPTREDRLPPLYAACLAQARR